MIIVPTVVEAHKLELEQLLNLLWRRVNHSYWLGVAVELPNDTKQVRVDFHIEQDHRGLVLRVVLTRWLV